MGKNRALEENAPVDSYIIVQVTLSKQRRDNEIHLKENNDVKVLKVLKIHAQYLHRL